MTEYERRWDKLYLGKYILAFYDHDDNLVAVFNNPYDMAVSLGVSINSARATVAHMKAGRRRHLIIRKHPCKLYLIKEKENEE